jgi:D-alanine-D-alanine ligase
MLLASNVINSDLYVSTFYTKNVRIVYINNPGIVKNTLFFIYIWMNVTLTDTFMKLNLGLIFGGRSGEHEVSLQSAQAIANAVDPEKYNLYLLAVDKSGNWFLPDANDYLYHADDPSKIKLKVRSDQQIALVPKGNSNRILKLSNGREMGSLDVVFPIIHGTFGEDGSLQGYMAMLNLPCIGADVLGSAVGMDKLIAKELLIQQDIKVADYLIADEYSNLEKLAYLAEEKFGFPLFIKPAASGSSVGVSKASDISQLKESLKKALLYDRRVLIEEAIKGREIECAILGNDKLLASVPGEIIPTHEFYSYEAKYLDADGARLDMPAKIPEAVMHRVQDIASRTYKALSCCGMARVDMFLTENGDLILNEINTLPGFTKISMYPKLMELSGVPFSALINRLVDLAIERHKQSILHLKNVLSAGSY